MKKFFAAFLMFVMLAVMAEAQSKAAAAKSGGTEGVAKGGVGMTWIDGEAYYLVSPFRV